MLREVKRFLSISLVLLVLSSCSSLKYVPQDRVLLKKVKVERSEKELTTKEVRSRIRQQPKHNTLIREGIYNLSGQDTSKWINRLLRKTGAPPMLYEPMLKDRSLMALEHFYFNEGYFNARVSCEENLYRPRRMKLAYHIDAGDPYRLREYSFQPSATPLDSLVSRSMSGTLLHAEQRFSGNRFDQERLRLAREARDNGFYAVNKDHFAFQVDSTLGNHEVKVNLQLKPPLFSAGNGQAEAEHRIYRIDKVVFLMDVPNVAFLRDQGLVSLADYDTLAIGDYYVVSRGRSFLRASTLLENCFITPGEPYQAWAVERTYKYLNALNGLKYVNIRFLDSASGEYRLDCYVTLSAAESNTFSFELEGTNTAGDMGVAGKLSYAHANTFRRGALFDFSVRGAYEALSASFSNDYLEGGVQMSLSVPRFVMPFAKRDSRKWVGATTNFKLDYNSLSRPEFLRTTISARMEYSWQAANVRYTMNPFDLAYMYMPRVDPVFAETYLKDGSFLKFSYEDQFVLKTAFGLLYSSLPQGIDVTNRRFFTLRSKFEEAGNILYPVFSLIGKQNAEGQYTLGNIPVSQYLKTELEFAHNLPLSGGNRLVYRVGLGVAYPYGNSRILPFEKRFYSGGANSVRGWSVRSLGPGTYSSPLTTIDFMNQTGDLKLDLSLEMRHRWFWVLEGAYFIDAGNIWTLRAYDNQPGGQFRFDSFYKEIACSVGAGIRLNFNILLARVDVGMKVYDPSGSSYLDKWRIAHIDSWDDFALHIAIGYPF